MTILVAKPVKKYLEGVKWKILSHPPYSPDFFRFPFVPVHAVNPFWRAIQFLDMKVSKMA